MAATAGRSGRREGRLLGHVGLGNRKDIRNAVEAAQAARGWAQTTGHARAQILYYIAENLAARGEEFAGRLKDLTGRDGRAEVEASVQRLFTWAAWADKVDGRAKGVPIRGIALAMNEPVGLIGVICPDEAPLLGLVSTVAPAVAMGNVPGGVVNILTGSHAELAPQLAGHMDVDAVWCFSSLDLSGVVERESAGTLKRTWVNDGRARDWHGRAGEGREFLEAAVEVKTVWVPYGE
jgi:aldehyde dehydrogenase (NAD+)